HGAASDTSGNVYIANRYNNDIWKYTPSSGTVVGLIESGLNQPQGVAVDTSGNVYIADSGNHAIKKWDVSTKQLSTITWAKFPLQVAVDWAGSVYFTTQNKDISKWDVSTGNVTQLASASPQSSDGVTVDASGNVYYGIFHNAAGSVNVWNAATQTTSS